MITLILYLLIIKKFIFYANIVMEKYHIILGSKTKRKEEETSVYNEIPTTQAKYILLALMDCGWITLLHSLGMQDEEFSRLLLKPPSLYHQSPSFDPFGKLIAYLSDALASIFSSPSIFSYFTCTQPIAIICINT